jgi:hypothetical protein
MDTYLKFLLTIALIFPWSAVLLGIWMYFKSKKRNDQ